MTRWNTTQTSQTGAVDFIQDEMTLLNQATRTEATAVSGTLTAAQMVNGLYVQTSAASAVGLTTATAALLVAAMYNVQIGSIFVFRVVNQDAADAITFTGGTNVTISGPGTNTVAAAASRTYVGYVTAVTTPAVTLYAM